MEGELGRGSKEAERGLCVIVSCISFPIMY
jgi:hypothetical protein